MVLSPQDMVNCDFNNYACDGGYLINSIDFLISEGVATMDCVGYYDTNGWCGFQCDSNMKSSIASRAVW